MINPDSDKFYTLPVAFNVLGRERYGEAWTGLEIVAHRLPDLATILPDVMEADARLGIFTMAELRRGTDMDRRIAHIVRNSRLSREIVTLALHPPAYEAAIQAFQRRTDVEQELRRLFYSGAVGAELLNDKNGVRVPIPATHWLADIFKIHLSTGIAEWADRSSATTYKYRGSVLIERIAFDRATTANQLTTSGAESRCRDWARELPKAEVWRKVDFIARAQELFDGLSKNSAKRVWDAQAPSEWKKPGPKS